jgi:hypothetical protein
MNDSKSPLEDLARQVGEIGGKAEAEIRKVIQYLNDEVVPEVRKHSFSALRSTGEYLTHLADELERRPKS